MIRMILKKVLSVVEIEARLHSGDLIHIKIKLGDKVLLDKEIDVIKGV